MLDWKKYEAITKYIYEMLGKQAGVKVQGYGASCKVTGKSGVSHQIDVLTAHSDGIHTYQTAIECKYWQEKINKDTVMKLAAIIEDAGISKGVIVSKAGFTPDGELYAKNKHISLVQLREIEDEDLKTKSKDVNLSILQIKINIFINRPQILTISVVTVDEKQLEQNLQSSSRLTIKQAAKKIPLKHYISQFQEYLHRQRLFGQTLTKRYDLMDASLINTAANTQVEIRGIICTGILQRIDASKNIQFTLVDQVWLIMKAHFEAKTFHFTKGGLLIEHSDV